MVYKLPFNDSARVVELGGGQSPMFHPNIDARSLDGVDIVADVSEPLPLETEAWDGVYSAFLLEHLPMQKVRPFLSEVHRVLVPGGAAVLITANLEEQARLLLERERWDDRLVHMVFGGDPPYPENYHRSSMRPEMLARLLLEAGFHQVAFYEHPVAKQLWGRSTDVIVHVVKSKAKVERNRAAHYAY